MVCMCVCVLQSFTAWYVCVCVIEFHRLCHRCQTTDKLQQEAASGASRADGGHKTQDGGCAEDA